MVVHHPCEMEESTNDKLYHGQSSHKRDNHFPFKAKSRIQIKHQRNRNHNQGATGQKLNKPAVIRVKLQHACLSQTPERNAYGKQTEKK